MPKKKKLALKSGIQTYQILTNDDEVCNPSHSSILLAVTNLCKKLASIYRESPLSTVSLSTVPGLVRFSNSTK